MTSSVVTKADLEAKYGERAESGSGSSEDRKGQSQAEILSEIANQNELFHSSDSTAFADVRVNDHRETWPVRSRGFKRWLCLQFYERTGRAPSSDALQSALNLAEAIAQFEGPERQVNVRVAGFDNKLYLDLTDGAWRAVEVDAEGWRIVEQPPVRFRRSCGMLRLPDPVLGGSLEMLRGQLNVSTEAEFVLAVAWLLAALRSRGPYPVLVLSGEQGSAKSTFSSVLRALVDPNCAPLRALPREDRDLFITASNGHVLAFDNVSRLPPWISDTLCRLATGGGFAVRQLYTDQDEVLFDATRPVILNGIEDIVSRPDLADRAIFLTLDPIPEQSRKTEQELWERLGEVHSQILGALLDAVVHGLQRIAETRLESLPRMADFAIWATACEGALWPEGSFWSAYTGNRDEAVDSVIEADPTASAVRSLMATRTAWTGTASQLLATLSEEVGEKVTRAKTWPATPRALSGRLRRAATFLRKSGIDVSFQREGRSRTRTIYIFNEPDAQGIGPSAQSASSANERQTATEASLTDGEDGADAKFEEAWREAAEERAAIYEYEAELTREEAEDRARALRRDEVHG